MADNNSNDAWKAKQAIPNKILNADGTYSTLQEIIGGGSVRLQEKSVNVSENGQSIVRPDEGYNGIRKVTVNTNVQPELQEKSVTITENGTTSVIPDEGYDGLSSVEVVTNVPSVQDIEYDLSKIKGYSTNSNFLEIITKVKINLGNITAINQLFSNLKSLTEVDIDTSNVTNFQYLFAGCTSLVTCPNLDTSKATNIWGMFNQCSALENVPVLDFSGYISDSSSMQPNMVFNGCTSLTNNSLQNILKSLLTMPTNIQSNWKTLSGIGLTSDQATICTGFDEWQTLVTNGWSTGY